MEKYSILVISSLAVKKSIEMGLNMINSDFEVFLKSNDYICVCPIFFGDCGKDFLDFEKLIFNTVGKDKFLMTRSPILREEYINDPVSIAFSLPDLKRIMHRSNSYTIYDGGNLYYIGNTSSDKRAAKLLDAKFVHIMDVMM